MGYVSKEDIKKVIDKTMEEIIEVPESMDSLRTHYGILLGKLYTLYDLLQED